MSLGKNCTKSKNIWNVVLLLRNGILLSKLFWPTVRKNGSNVREIFLKLQAAGWEFAKVFKSLEQFIQIVNGQKNFWQQNAFLTWGFSRLKKSEQL